MELKDILARCDHTLLGVTSTWAEIQAICDDGMKYQTASVCIPASFVKQANEYVVKAQSALNAGDLKGALAALKAGMKAYPDNRTLPQNYRRVLQLRNVLALLDAMDRADNAASMSAALTAARIGLAANTTPELEKHFADYEKKIQALSKTEKKVEKTPSIVEPVITPGA